MHARVDHWICGRSSAIQKILDLGDGSGLAQALAETAGKGCPTLFTVEHGVLPIPFFEDVENRAFGDPCYAFVVIPVQIYDDSVIGYLIVGLNTRRPYDAEYQEWIEVYANLIGASAASVALYEEEVRERKHQEDQATKDREALSAEVAVLAQEASGVTEKLQNFHEIAGALGLGYFEYGVDGKLLHANVSAQGWWTESNADAGQEAFFYQTGHSKDFSNVGPFSFREYIHPHDDDLVMEQWHKLVGGQSTTFEIRWRNPRTDSSKEDDGRDCLWTLTACMPIIEHGKVTGIFGCNTDICAQKEATRTALFRMEAERRLASFTEIARE